MFKKFGKNLTEPNSKLALAIPPDFKSNIKDYKIKNRTDDPLKVLKWSIRTQNLLKGPCVACGSVDKIEIHHIKKLAGKAKARSPIHQIMSKLNRKQVPLCEKCHNNIHRGVFDKNMSPRKAR